MKAAYKDIGELEPEYVAVVLDDMGDQVWQSVETYSNKTDALGAARAWYGLNKTRKVTCYYE